MEVAQGIHRIQAPFGDRFVCSYLLVGETCSLLIDTGIDGTPGESIQPYMAHNGIDPGTVRYVINSHSDYDHTAGNGAMRELAPQALFMCHRLDQAMVEDMTRILDDRYDEFRTSHGIYESAESREDMLANSRTVPIDVTLVGGETVRLSPAWTVEIWHTAGHSRGHLSVYDERSRSLIICDAALYNAVLRADGQPAFPPTYRYVDTYEASIQRFQATDAELLLTSHYPVYRGAEIAEFLGESQAFADRVDQELRGALKKSGRPQTMRQLIEELSPKLGKWPDAAKLALSQPLQGHLERMVAVGLVEMGTQDGLVTFQWSERA